jgi:hypothetical protein
MTSYHILTEVSLQKKLLTKVDKSREVRSMYLTIVDSKLL